MSARADLCGGRSAMIVPTATSSTSYEESNCPYSRHLGQSGFGSCRKTGYWQLRRLASLPRRGVQSLDVRDVGTAKVADTLYNDHTGCYCSFAYSALACFRMGMSGSASFQSVRKSL